MYPAAAIWYGRRSSPCRPAKMINPGIIVARRPLGATCGVPVALPLSGARFATRTTAGGFFFFFFFWCVFWWAPRGFFVGGGGGVGVGACGGGGFWATSPRVTGARGSASAGPTPRPSGGVMCPSYLATRDEKDSTARPRPGVAGAGQRDVSLRLATTRGRRCPDLMPCPARGSADCPAGIRHGHVQGRGPLPALPPPGPPACPTILGWRPRWAP